MTEEIHAQETTIEESRRYYEKWFRYLRENFVRRGFWYGFTWTVELLARLIIGSPLRRFSQVNEHIFIGGQYRRRGWPRMKRWGVDAVVNMRLEYDDKDAGIAPDHYLYLPVIDTRPPSLEQLEEGVKFIQEEIDHGHGVYIHCEAGVGRSIAMAAAYLIRAHGLSPLEAWDEIRQTRPFIRPTDSQRARIQAFAAQPS
ncbi:MAG: dual specificity protein phosphatase family protein [Anaerolineales bacterium]|nr:dual specificity protein phosphatase family protein [Anaerolineales bacterium]